MKFFSRFKHLFIFLLVLCSIYGLVRLYYAVTAGFTIGNITSDLQYDARWVTKAPSKEQKEEIDQALAMPYTYLGKGCQAYVFESEDGKYVLKFFKYQRFRPQGWLDAFTWIPPVERYKHNKAEQKKLKLDNVFRSWNIAFNDLRQETGVLYLHLNKTTDLKKEMTIYDKMGIEHRIHLDQMEFLVQRKAVMLCSLLQSLIAEGKQEEAKRLIDRLLAMLLFEYQRGYADNDHALMQNTGVWEGNPVHIDVGQLIYNPSVQDPSIYSQELYDKTYKFHLWLKKQDEPLASYLQNRLVAIIGEDYFLKGPYIHKSDVAKIPHQEKDARP